jgi:hypothetical protein
MTLWEFILSTSIAPRAVLTITTPFFILAISAVPIRCRVLWFSGKCIDITSLSSSNYRKPTHLTPTARSYGNILRLWQMIFIPNGSARCATALPIRPMPKIPNVFPLGSCPKSTPVLNRLLRRARSSGFSLRIALRRRNIVRSVVAPVTGSGAYVKAILWRRQASTLIRS